MSRMSLNRIKPPLNFRTWRHTENYTISLIKSLNNIHHTGCIIFEALPHHLKVHSYYTLLDHSKTHQFEQLLHALVQEIPNIKGLGISGFMKLPYKDTRFFEHSPCLPEKYYPRNPRAEQREKALEFICPTL